jgi:RHS repeat-associated protein
MNIFLPMNPRRWQTEDDASVKDFAKTRPDNTRIRTYVWGNDLSGSLQGAGGVGGLLEISYYGTSTTNCFPAYDGNGNIMALVNVADGTVVANYDYGAFGEPLRITGVMAKNNPFRFSTKYADDESDLLYYGYRYYKPSTGTWPSRDPINELGFRLLATGRQFFINTRSNRYINRLDWFLSETHGPNIFGFVGNDAINHLDALGLVQIINNGKFTQSVVDDITKQINTACGTGFKNYVKLCGKHWECIGNLCSSAKVILSDKTPLVHGDPSNPVIGDTVGQYQFGCTITLYLNNGTPRTQWGGVALHEFNHCCGGTDGETDTMKPGWEGVGGQF